LLVRRELVDAALVALRTGERLGDEGLAEGDRVVRGVLACAQGDDVGVVVLSRQVGGVEVPHERRAHSAHLVRRDLLAVAGPAEDDPQAPRLGDDGLPRGEAAGRVVVLGVVLVSPVVPDVVPPGGGGLDTGGLELEAGVLGGDVDTQGPILPGRRGRSVGGPPAAPSPGSRIVGACRRTRRPPGCRSNRRWTAPSARRTASTGSSTAPP